MALSKVTINGPLLLPDDATPQRGKLIFTPGNGLLVDTTNGVTLAGSVPVTIASDGSFAVQLPATDNTGTQPEPNTWNWTVRFELYDDTLAPFSFALPASLGTVKFADLVRVLPAAGTYLIIPGPPGPPGGAGDGALLAANNLADLADAAQSRSHLGLGSAATAAISAFDAAGSASTAQGAAISTAASDATTKVSAEATRADSTYLAKASDLGDLHDVPTARGHLGLGTAATQPSSAFDTAGAAAAALVTAKAYADTGDAATLVTAKAYTDAHSGGGGSSIKTRSVRITDDNLGGLPSAPSWTVVVTSGGTHLQCSIPAVANDRIRACPNFMRVGSHFTDFVLLDNTGAISRYASTESSSPGAEGDPAEYPSLSQEYVTSADMFTVSAGHIDGGGNVTIGLAHQGTGSGIVYAHTVYPWRLRLENIGPEPA